MTGWSVRWQSGSPSRSFHLGAQQSGGRSLLPRSQGKTAATNPGGYCCSHWRRNWIPSSDPVLYPRPRLRTYSPPLASTASPSSTVGKLLAKLVTPPVAGLYTLIQPLI